MRQQFIHRGALNTPQRMSLDLLAALCDAVDSPNDLIEMRVVEAVRPAAVSDPGHGVRTSDRSGVIRRLGD